MKCHYEVLDVSRNADDTEIKSAYRKLALKWHPDKNLDNNELAKKQFQMVRLAYEILSDRKERAYYDNHRDQILRGPSSEFEDKCLDVFRYFNATCFRGYGDGRKGFYTVYRNVFHEIAKEDLDFMQNKEDFWNIPNFGDSFTDYETVLEFYEHWLNYETKRSYFWLNAYNVRFAQNRKYRRMAEKENKKLRDKARQDRNEEVRDLVAFVKRRDPRVRIKIWDKRKLLEDRKKREMLRQQELLERQEELNHFIKNQPEWAKFDNFKLELEKIEKRLVAEENKEISEVLVEEIQDNVLFDSDSMKDAIKSKKKRKKPSKVKAEEKIECNENTTETRNEAAASETNSSVSKSSKKEKRMEKKCKKEAVDTDHTCITCKQYNTFIPKRPVGYKYRIKSMKGGTILNGPKKLKY